jgi:hypothetical protein
VRPYHPDIERVMHKEVGQDWANHSPYTKGNPGCLSGLAEGLRGVVEPAVSKCYGVSLLSKIAL